MNGQKNPVNWFEIPTFDLHRARDFYQEILGVELTINNMNGFEMAWFPMEMNGPGAAGTLVKFEGYTPSHDGTLVYFNVEDIEATLKSINENGGKTLVPKTGIGEYGFIAHFEDTEGNRVALHSIR